MPKHSHWIAIASAVVIAAPCAAQNSASLAINAGSATDVTGVGSSALTVAPSLSRASTLSSATFSASATKFASDAWSASISSVMSGRVSNSAISPAFDLTLAAATTSYDFSYAVADLVPAIEAKTSRAKIFVGTRLAAAGTSSILAPTGGTAPLPVTGGSRTTKSSTARTAIAGVTFTSVAQGGEVASIGYRAETGRVVNAHQSEHTVSASVANSGVVVGGSVTTRAMLAQRSTTGMASLGIAVTKSAMLQFAAGSYPSNPMLGTAAGRFVNAGVTMRIGGRTGSMPAVRGVAPPARGMTRISIRAEDARHVELAGDFNKWQPVAATRAGNGVWYADLILAPGEYRYAFRVDGKEWRVPAGVAAVDDEFGGKSAWLTVRPR